MRLLRARRRNGLRSLRVMLYDTEIDCLVTKGFLKSERRRDHAAIQSAIDDFICHALGAEQDQPPNLSRRNDGLEFVRLPKF
jgi:hypothetical protein